MGVQEEEVELRVGAAKGSGAWGRHKVERVGQVGGHFLRPLASENVAAASVFARAAFCSLARWVAARVAQTRPFGPILGGQID